MKIGKYISDLLFENDFVILPDIGEFSTKYIPAKFIPELKKVQSPSKVITFNERNKTGGGLLIEYIAKKENISSIQSREFVQKFVSEMKNSLHTGKKVELEKVGSFSRDEHGLLVFEPDTTVNYLSDSIGMSAVKEPAKKSEEEAKSELDKVIEEVSTNADKMDSDKETNAVSDQEKEEVKNTDEQDIKDEEKEEEREEEKEEKEEDMASSVKSDAELAKMQGKSEDKTKEEHKEIYTKVPEEEKPEEKKISAEQEKQLPEKEKMEEVKREEPKRDFGIKPRQPVIKTVSSSDTESSPHGTTKSKPMDFPKTGSKEKTGISSAKKDKTPKLTKQKHKEGGLPPALKWVAFTVVPLLIIIVVLALNYDYIFGDKSVVFNRESETPAVQQTEDVQDEEFADEAPTTDDQAETDQPEQVQDVPSTPQQGRMVYYVIVGSFEEEHSALILVEELKNEGAQNARVFPVNPQGFYRVAYGFYYDLAEAETVLQDAKQINENAWILHRQN